MFDAKTGIFSNEPTAFNGQNPWGTWSTISHRLVMTFIKAMTPQAAWLTNSHVDEIWRVLSDLIAAAMTEPPDGTAPPQRPPTAQEIFDTRYAAGVLFYEKAEALLGRKLQRVLWA